MGMDVYGKKPNPYNDCGEYFRNNCWGWRPLWNYCYQIAPELISEKLFLAGHHNDGAGLGAVASKKLAKKLHEEITSGRCAEYQKAYDDEIKALLPVTCEQCNGTGDRPGWVQYKRPDGELIDPWTDYNTEKVEDLSGNKIEVSHLNGLSVHLRDKSPELLEGAKRGFPNKWAKDCNGCNGCQGKGTRENMEAAYPFTVINVKEFSEFLANCGGFCIN